MGHFKVLVVVLIIFLGMAFVTHGKIKRGGKMKLESTAFKHNQMIPSKYTCEGEDMNPPLKVSAVPKNAKTLVLIMDDPDAPMGTWVHWLIWNINPQTTEIAEDSVPAQSIEGTTSWRRTGYGGPCPPSGTHRYFFKLYALDIDLKLSPETDKLKLEKAMTGHILDKTELIGLYKKQR